MSIIIEAEAPPLKQWEDGSIRVGGTRLLLELVINAYDRGLSAEEIVHSFPSVTLADIHAVIAYYLKHKSDVESYLAEVEKQGAEIRKKIDESSPAGSLRERLLARRRSTDTKT